MKYKLLVEKLDIIDEKFIISEEIKKYCSILKMEYSDAIIYLTRYKYLIVILKGIFYNPSIAERKMKSYDISYRDAIVKALEIKGINNWYFGLETAVKFNNLTHEFFVMDFIVNDKIARSKPLEVFGNKIKLVKIKPELFRFGIKKSKKFGYSDIEKTVLDMIYLKRYGGYDDNTIANYVMPYIEHCSKEKLKRYAKKYNKKMSEFVNSL
ncbi:MAG: hypothetical protein KAK00_06195 [Nanoarchaeota archaeon]|nr:hypothetical protein [Nanoarchaeota archaeon]